MVLYLLQINVGHHRDVFDVGLGLQVLEFLLTELTEHEPVLLAVLLDLHELQVLQLLDVAVRVLDRDVVEVVGEVGLRQLLGADVVVAVEAEPVEDCAISQRNLECPVFHVGLLPYSCW